MAETYIVCSGATSVEISVELAPAGGCNLSEQYWLGGKLYNIYNQVIDVTLDVAAAEEFFIEYTCVQQYSIIINGILQPGFPYTYDVPVQITIPAGVTTYQFDHECLKVIEQGNTQWAYDTDTSELVLLPQQDEPVCYTPPACHLSVTGSTATSPSIRGGSDGQIYAGVSGATGTTINWFLNGVSQTGTTRTHVFSGLTAGIYYVRSVEGICSSQVQVQIFDGEFRTSDFQTISPTDKIVAVENPIILNVNTSTNSVNPLVSINEFRVTGTISDVVVVFNLVYPYVYTAEFRSKEYPDRSTYFLESILSDEIGNPVGTNSGEEITTSFSEVLQKDPIISRLYYISSSGSTITLRSKETGNMYDLSTSNVTITGSNLTLTNTQGGVTEFDGALVSNYSIYTELFVDEELKYGDTPNPVNYKRVLELELPYNKTNQHQFDLSSSLKNFVNTSKFDFNFTGATYLADMMCSYYLKYGEKYPLVPNSNTKKKRYKGITSYGWVINSALNFEDSNTMESYRGLSGTTWRYDTPFLNTAPNTKYSHRDSDELYYVVIPKNYGFAMAVRGNIYMYDGTTYSNVNFFSIPTTTLNNFGGVCCLNMGYNKLGLSSYETSGNKIRKVEFWIRHVHISPLYTEKKSYLLEIDEQPSYFNVAFLSKLGTYETFSFVGERQEQQEISRSSYQKPYPISDDGSAGLGFQYNSIFNTMFTKTYVVNTGIISEDVYYYLMGLLQSNKIYNYTDVHQNYITVIGQTATKSSNENQYSIQLIFRETISENNIST